MTPLRVLDLFSGIGGFSLGLERTGMKTVAFCEIEEFPRRVLKKHWPEVPCYDDIRTLTAARLAADGIGVDVICGGFPCVDISNAGQKAGISGERSGLWKQYARIIGELRPQYAIMENVAALLYRGMGTVLGDLAEIGYGCQWHCIPASHVGAPHERDRTWIIAYPNGSQLEGGRLSGRIYQEYANACRRPRWENKSSIHRVDDGLPNRSHRLKAIGNAVVPAIPELIGRAIIASMQT
jgi:DNA (cytosine-5)-methyltransferase 1